MEVGLSILLVLLFAGTLVFGGAAFGGLCAAILVVQAWHALVWRRQHGRHHGR